MPGGILKAQGEGRLRAVALDIDRVIVRVRRWRAHSVRLVERLFGSPKARYSGLARRAQARLVAGMTQDSDAFYRMAQAAIDGFPDPFRQAAADVVLRVADWPQDGMCAELGIDDPLELTGLYDGIPMTEKSFSDPAPFPDTVWLFREPILAEWRDRGDVTLEALVAHVTVHEFAHHFGWSDDDIAAIDQWWL